MKTLKELCKTLGGKIPEGQRIYCVTDKSGNFRFVLSNSKGQAALAACTVETVPLRDVTQAAFEALGELSRKEAGDE